MSDTVDIPANNMKPRKHLVVRTYVQSDAESIQTMPKQA